TLAAVLADDNVDAVLTIFIPPLVTAPNEVADAVRASAAGTPDKPVQAIFMRAEGAPDALAPIPCYAFPEPAAIALARVAAYAEWRRRPEGTVPALDGFDGPTARRIVDDALACGGGWLSQDRVQALLDAAGITQADARVAADVGEAAAAAAAIGYPVAIKGVGPALLHKTERKAIRLDLADEAAVRTACAELAQSLGDDLQGLLV